MTVPLEITFKNMEPSPALGADIRSKTDALERFEHDIFRCHVTMEASHYQMPSSGAGPTVHRLSRAEVTSNLPLGRALTRAPNGRLSWSSGRKAIEHLRPLAG